MNYLLDTNVISELIAPKPNVGVVNFFKTANNQQLYLSVVTLGEIKFGIEVATSQAKKQQLLSWFEQSLLPKFANKIIDLDKDALLTWASLSAKLKQQGKPLPIMDSLIAASCLVNKLTLVTRNEKDFINIGVKLINPFL